MCYKLHISIVYIVKYTLHTAQTTQSLDNKHYTLFCCAELKLLTIVLCTLHALEKVLGNCILHSTLYCEYTLYNFTIFRHNVFCEHCATDKSMLWCCQCTALVAMRGGAARSFGSSCGSSIALPCIVGRCGRLRGFPPPGWVILPRRRGHTPSHTTLQQCKQ